MGNARDGSTTHDAIILRQGKAEKGGKTGVSSLTLGVQVLRPPEEFLARDERQGKKLLK